MERSDLSRLVHAGLLTGASDGLFASVLSVTYLHSTVARLWQGVAAVPLGARALEGGTPMALIGLLIHFGVAFTWSAVFLFVVMRAKWVRGVLGSPYGVLKVAAVYGPCIWLVMSWVVIPLLLQRPPAITPRWWIQLVGHAPFVGLPIVWSIGDPADRAAA